MRSRNFNIIGKRNTKTLYHSKNRSYKRCSEYFVEKIHTQLRYRVWQALGTSIRTTTWTNELNFCEFLTHFVKFNVITTITRQCSLLRYVERNITSGYSIYSMFPFQSFCRNINNYHVWRIFHFRQFGYMKILYHNRKKRMIASRKNALSCTSYPPVVFMPADSRLKLRYLCLLIVI